MPGLFAQLRIDAREKLDGGEKVEEHFRLGPGF